MKIRLTGTKEETLTFATMLDNIYDVVSVSTFYPNTRKCLKSNEGRIYIEINFDFPHANQ